MLNKLAQIIYDNGKIHVIAKCQCTEAGLMFQEAARCSAGVLDTECELVDIDTGTMNIAAKLYLSHDGKYAYLDWTTQDGDEYTFRQSRIKLGT